MIARPRFRGLFPKYLLALFMAVAIPLTIDAVVEAWFSYRDQRARLDQLLDVQAASAATEIHDFIFGITNQLDWLVQLPWSDEPDERRRTDALHLLRQAPAIVSLTLLDNQGLERLYVSRIGLNRVETRTDRSTDLALVGERSAKIWFGDVSYNRGSEPYLILAVAGNRPSLGAVIAEVNLKLIWDVVSAIKVGKTGFAFVLDRPGRLIAHPDISLVLRGAEDITSKPFNAIRDAIGSRGGLTTRRDGQGQAIAASAAPILGPDWTVVVQQPLSEAYASIYAALWRTATILGIGTLFAGLLAYALAHRMTEPIRLLEDGTERIGAGYFDHRISIETKDEFQRLANSFNKMASELALAQQHQERITKLRRFLAPQVADLVDRTGDESILDGRHTDVVVIFCDLRGFTAFSAEVTPEELMRLLSEYYECLGNVITQFAATLISFSGDGLMVLVNAPVPIEEPILNAVDLAIEMQESVQEVIAGWRSRGYQVGFGVGLASGSATVGRIGYENRFDYTAIGSVVNLAARLCASAGDLEILVDAEVAANITGKRPLESLGNRTIKGFDEPVPVFKVPVNVPRNMEKGVFLMHPIRDNPA
jgi:adenylate cyclase